MDISLAALHHYHAFGMEAVVFQMVAWSKVLQFLLILFELIHIGTNIHHKLVYSVDQGLNNLSTCVLVLIRNAGSKAVKVGFTDEELAFQVG